MGRSESGSYNEEDEIPLLEGKAILLFLLIFLDLDIDIERIKLKLKSVITQRGIKENADYDDLAGPLMVCIIFGFLLLLVTFIEIK